MEEKLLLTINEAAKRLGIGRSHAYRYAMRGDLETVTLGRSRRVPLDALFRFIEKLRAGQVED